MSISLWPTAAPTPLQYFASLVQTDPFPLLEVAACLGHDAEPQLDVQQVLSDIDRLQVRLHRRLSADAGWLQRLGVLNRFFYGDLGFAGNWNNYYDPENSYLHAVLRNRRGIPISLAVVWLELAQSVGLSAQGVSFPGHFLMKVRAPEGVVMLDPMNGESLSADALRERLSPFQPPAQTPEAGQQANTQAPDIAHERPPLGLYLQPASNHDIVLRMLRNLKEIHRTDQDWAQLVAVQNRLLILHPQAWEEWRDRGLAYAQWGRGQQARSDLLHYLLHAQQAPDAEAIRNLLDSLPI